MKKIAIVGCPASGKTYLAQKLAQILNIPVYHLDQLFWGGQTLVTDEEFFNKQKYILQKDMWIAEGDFLYSKSYDYRLSKADTIIFFSLPKALVFQRLLKRLIIYFNKLRPDLGNTSRFHIDWNLVKYIWNYPTLDVYITKFTQDKSKNVIILKNTYDEKVLLEKVKVESKSIFSKVTN